MSEDIYKDIVPLPLPLSNVDHLSERDKELLNIAMEADHGTPIFKIRHFVGDAQITRYAKYKQIMIELRSREEVIEQTLVTLEKNKSHIDECKEKIASATSQATKRSLEWDLTSHVNDVAKTERRLKMAYRERDNFLKVLKEMYENGEAYLEDGRDMKDSLFDEELSEQLEAEHWVFRLGKQAALDLIAYGHIGTGNLEAISMLDEATAVKTLRLAITYSHGVKKSLGLLEQSVIDAIESGTVNTTTDIEKQRTPKEIQ